MAAQPNHLEPWANPPNIFANSPAAQAFFASMNVSQRQPQQNDAQRFGTDFERQLRGLSGERTPQSPLAAYAAPSTATPGGGQGPRSVRTNNPGAIEYGPFAQRAGATGSDGRFAVFPDMASGYGAMDRLLSNYGQQGRNTVTSIIERWAPRNADNNSTDAYIAAVARSVGLDPNAPIPADMMPRVAEAMAQFEAGRPVPRY